LTLCSAVFMTFRRWFHEGRLWFIQCQ